MNIEERKRIIDTVSRIMAIISVDIDNHQSINDLSLNIVAENWFRDLINFLEGTKYLNLNFYDENAPKVDLVDHSQKKALQITSTGTKEKIDKTLTALALPNYQGFDISLYFLKEKPNLTPRSKNEILASHGIKIDDHLFDATDLIKKMNNLDGIKLDTLYQRFFSGIAEKYTENMVLDITIRCLLKNSPRVPKRYDEDFGSVDTTKKLGINRVNNRISSKINGSLDYTMLFLGTNFDESVLCELKDYIVEVIYRQLLQDQLKSRYSSTETALLTTSKLHELAISSGVDFNRVLGALHSTIDGSIHVRDFNSMEIAWIIVSYFFEICDIGVKELATSE